MFVPRHLSIVTLLAASSTTVPAAASAATSQAPARAAPRVADVPELAGLAERWTAALATLDAPGFALAVVKEGDVLALDAFGVRNTAREPATVDTCYYIASATKPYTAMAVCLLAGEGRVDLDAPIKEHLPELELPDAELTATLSLRDLLSHRHGIHSGPIVLRDAYTGEITDELYFELLREAEIAHGVTYTNLHFTLAGRVIEAASGTKWQDFLATRLFAPAGMTRTSAYASVMYGRGEHAEPLVLVDGRWVRSQLVKTDRTMHAAGGIGTTARDAARWLILNTERGRIDGRRILPEALAKEYYAQQSARPKTVGKIRIEEGYALGWNTGKYRERSRPYFFHGGGYAGASSYFCFLPAERIGVAVLSNCGEGGADLATIVSIDVLDRLLGVEGEPDLLPEYEEWARERRAQLARDLPQGANPAVASGGLSRPAEEYAGKFAHPQDGELVIALERGELTARIGDLPYTLVSTGQDEFTAWVVPGMKETGSFDLGSDGTVASVTLSGIPLRVFERVGRESGSGEETPREVTPALYVGTYQCPELPGYTFVAREEQGQLLGHMTAPPPSPAQPELVLQPAGLHKFQVPDEGARLVFRVEGKATTGFTLQQDGQSFEFRRSAG